MHLLEMSVGLSVRIRHFLLFYIRFIRYVMQTLNYFVRAISLCFQPIRQSHNFKCCQLLHLLFLSKHISCQMYSMFIGLIYPTILSYNTYHLSQWIFQNNTFCFVFCLCFINARLWYCDIFLLLFKTTKVFIARETLIFISVNHAWKQRTTASETILSYIFKNGK